MDIVLQALGVGFIALLIIGWVGYVTIKLNEIEERLDRQSEINTLFKRKKHKK